MLPRVHAFDADARVLILEDLGGAERMDHALARGAELDGAAACLGAFLGRVHAGTRDAALANAFANDEMRRLHGEHIFVLPLRANDFPLAAGLLPRARALREDAELVRIADAAYARYLEPEGALVHGDVQAGNVLLAPSGPKLLDAEIAHVGDPAFDLGTLVAHLVLPAAAEGRLGSALPAVDAAIRAYRGAHGAGAPPLADSLRYAGLELLRRTIGAARARGRRERRRGPRRARRAEAWIRRPPADLASLTAELEPRRRRRGAASGRFAAPSGSGGSRSRRRRSR